MSIAIAAMAIDSCVPICCRRSVLASPSIDRLLAALAAMEFAAAANAERSREVEQRAADMRAGLEAGRTVLDIVEAEPSPRTVELLSLNMAILETVGAELRAAQAAALRDEGLTLTAIAELFGVSRQRVSALVRGR